jgi:hypothetical protein
VLRETLTVVQTDSLQEALARSRSPTTSESILEICAGVVHGALGLAVFLTFSSLAFLSDLAEPRPSPYWWVLVYAADTGIVAAGYGLASTRFIRLLPLAVAVNLLSIFGLKRILPLYSRRVASSQASRTSPDQRRPRWS